jgi:hypothetical protein
MVDTEVDGFLGGVVLAAMGFPLLAKLGAIRLVVITLGGLGGLVGGLFDTTTAVLILLFLTITRLGDGSLRMIWGDDLTIVSPFDLLDRGGGATTTISLLHPTSSPDDIWLPSLKEIID